MKTQWKRPRRIDPAQQASALEVLHSAYFVLSQPQHWTRGANAVDRNNYTVGVTNPVACRWCLGGALAAALHMVPTDNRLRSKVSPLVYAAVAYGLALQNMSIARMQQFNDRGSTTHEEMLRVVERAITFMEAQTCPRAS